METTLNNDFIEEYRNILSNGALGSYQETVQESLATNNPEGLLLYAIEKIPDEPSESFELSNVFLIISECAHIQDTVRSFAMDMMLYCEDSFSEFKNKKEVLAFFNKNIKQLL